MPRWSRVSPMAWVIGLTWLAQSLAGLWQHPSGNPTSAVLGAVAAAAVLVTVILAEHVLLGRSALAAAAGRDPLGVVGERTRARVAPRHCDPDAAGRPRPRAPSSNPAAV